MKTIYNKKVMILLGYSVVSHAGNHGLINVLQIIKYINNYYISIMFI